MASFESRIVLQQNRFNLIQQAAEEGWTDLSSSQSRQLVSTQLEMLEQNWSKFQADHESLCHSGSESLKDEPYIKFRTFERCHAFYVCARANLLRQRDEIEFSRPSSSLAISATPIVAPTNHRAALPRIVIPQFSGDYNSWVSFRDLFSSLVGNNPDLGSVEKMHYLKTSLSGEAARLIANLSISAENFLIAWDTLVTRYENKRVLIAAQLEKLTNLKPLKPRSARGLSSFHATITEVQAALRALGRLEHFGEDLLLHLLVKLLDTDTHEAWEIKLGSSTIPPTFSQFEEFLMARTRAMENLERNSSSALSTRDRANPFDSRTPPVRANLAATSSNNDAMICPRCKNSHYLARCPLFQSDSVQQRHDFIGTQRLCFNCLGYHTVDACRSTKRCLKCGKKHHTSIHRELMNRNVTATALPTENFRARIHQASINSE